MKFTIELIMTKMRENLNILLILTTSQFFCVYDRIDKTYFKGNYLLKI